MAKQMRINTDEVGYIYLPAHPKELTPGIVKKSIRLDELIEDYKGPLVVLDFNADNELIGIEVVD